MSTKKRARKTYPIVFRERGRGARARSCRHYLAEEPLRCGDVRTLCGRYEFYSVDRTPWTRRVDGPLWDTLIFGEGEAPCPDCRRIVRLRLRRPWSDEELKS